LRFKFDKGMRPMKIMLATLILGVSIALPAAEAFATEGGCHHNFPISGSNPWATPQTEPTSPAGPATGP
jgi:hypothetical protein